MNVKKTKFRLELAGLFMVILAGIAASCDFGEPSGISHAHATNLEEYQPVEKINWPSYGNLVEVRTTGMNFILPKEIPSGWTTFRYSNQSDLTHFMLIDKLPVHNGEQITYQDFKAVPPVFNAAMNLINQGESEKGFAEFSRLPAWFPKVIYSGGVGIISPGETAQTSVYLKPGTYVIECYIKTGGVFHTMSRALIVNEDHSNETPPTSTVDIEISREGGIVMHDQPIKGIQTIAVHFEDQDPHEHFLGHDVHLVKLNGSIEMEDINSWMNWADPKGLNTPPPATFIGGAQEMPAGKTAYITVDLQPGKYALVSEVPDPASKGMLKTFTVPR